MPSFKTLLPPGARRALPLAALALALFEVQAEPASPPEQPAAIPIPGKTTPLSASVKKVFNSERELGEAQLADLRGGTLTLNTVEEGYLYDNVAKDVTTGNNTVSSGSFANFSGLPTVIQNSGANVLIQNSMSIQVQLN